MPYSNYPGGFPDGVLIRNLNLSSTAKVFYVGNNASLEQGEKGASDTTSAGTYLRPFSTIDYAIGQCAANRGDVILVRSNNATSITAAGGITMDVAGVRIIGLGEGENRPTITFATATAASIVVSAANNRISNFIFKCNIASQSHMFDVKGTDLTIDNCAFREGSATGLSFITADTADADSDRLILDNCEFYAPTAGNYDNAIQLAKDFKQVRIINCRIYGDFDDAGIHIPSGGNAQIDCQIENCKISNLQSTKAAISINGTSSTGKIINCYLETDAQSTALDAGGLEVFNVQYHNGTDQMAAVPALTPISGSFDSILGTKVSKSAANLPAGTTQNIFTVTGGRVLINLLIGQVGTVIQAQACNLKVTSAPTSGTAVDLAANLDINADEAGTIYLVEGDGTALVGINAGAGLNALGSTQIVVPAGSIRIETSATNTGTTSWDLWYKPLDVGASVASA